MAADEDHVEVTVQQLAELYSEHQQAAPRIQRVANRITAALARPAMLTFITALVLAWIAGNTVAEMVGSPALERFPFPDLGLVVAVAALLIALLILSTQRHEEELAEKRARLTLQIAVLSEKKIAKVIALLEEQRRDNPLPPARVDAEAEVMAAPTDPRSSLELIEQRDGG